MKGKRGAMRMRDRAGYMWLPIGNETGPGHNGPVGRRGISKRKSANRVRKMRVETPTGPRHGRGGGLPTRWPVWRVVARLSRDRHVITDDAIVLWGVGCCDCCMGGCPNRAEGFEAWDAEAGSVLIGIDSWGVMEDGEGKL